MILSVLALTSCKDKNSGDSTDSGSNGTDGGADNTTASDNTYTVYVKDTNGNPVANIDILVYAEDFSFSCMIKTDASGKASTEAEIGEKSLYAALGGKPDGYEDITDEEFTFNAENELTITLTPTVSVSNKVTYTVTVLDENGNAVAGAVVQLCTDSVCVTAESPTDASGVTTIELNASEMHVKVLQLPDAYDMPETDADGYHAVIAEGETTITIVVPVK